MSPSKSNPRLKLGTKLQTAFLGAACITLVLGILSYRGAVKGERATREVGLVRLPSVETLLVIKQQTDAIRSFDRSLLVRGLPAADRARQYENLTKAEESWKAAWKTYEALPQSPEEAGLWSKFVPAWNAWRQVQDRFQANCRSFDEIGIPNPADLKSQLERFTKDHHVVAGRVLQLLQDPTATFEGGED
ncbi:MAG: MCP four helix bundle domain-containing protein, partial [Verrucomicrobiales bacterium]|nr:MCP four helix bundle domain-containing protein [Verrucomicrobiales bacterium]